MPSLDDVALAHTDLTRDDLQWLHLLISDWQIIADLSFADLVLWLPDRQGQGYWGGAQMRPVTGPTAILDDLVGAFVPRGRRPLVDVAFDLGRIGREGDPEWRDDVPIRVETIPVLRHDRVVAVVARNTNLLGVRTPSRLELAYLQAASDLTRMISLGRFPFDVERGGWTATPGVGDGFIRTDADGLVTYASPNAQSAYRRLGLQGDVTGQHFASATMNLVPAPSLPTDEALPVTLSGRHPRETELGTPAATVTLRVIPLQPADSHEGAVILLRDVTELRRRERELITKDATIREIHHRVKNNLQTVAALLRLQTRRLQAPEARAALEEAVRRVGSIAIVHETLSHTFDEQLQFDDVVDRLSHMVFDYSAGGGQVMTRRTGSFGQLRAEVATPLAMVLTEVLQNAAQHGFAGRSGHVEIRVRREAGRLSVTVSDDGHGLPVGFDPHSSGGLGTSIVRTLVESELGGVIHMSAGPDQGTVVDIAIPIEEVFQDGAPVAGLKPSGDGGG